MLLQSQKAQQINRAYMALKYWTKIFKSTEAKINEAHLLVWNIDLSCLAQYKISLHIFHLWNITALKVMTLKQKTNVFSSLSFEGWGLAVTQIQWI